MLFYVHVCVYVEIFCKLFFAFVEVQADLLKTSTQMEKWKVFFPSSQMSPMLKHNNLAQGHTTALQSLLAVEVGGLRVGRPCAERVDTYRDLAVRESSCVASGLLL